MHSPPPFTKPRIIKNIAVMCIGVLLLFIAYDGPTMLQSTMNSDRGIGVASQAILYSLACLSALLFPKYVIRKLGSKNTFALSMCSYIPYVAYNYYPHWSLMIPTSILIGLGAPLLWSAQATYLNEVSIMYTQYQMSELDIDREQGSSKKTSSVEHSKNTVKVKKGEIVASNKSSSLDSHSNNDSPLSFPNEKYDSNLETPNSASFEPKKEIRTSANAEMAKNGAGFSECSVFGSKLLESTTARIFGIHGMCFLTCHVLGNLIAYCIVSSGVTEDRNSSLVCVCGAEYCNADSECFSQGVESPIGEGVRNTLTTVCCCVGVVGTAAVVFFLDPLESERREDVRFSLGHLLATYRTSIRRELLLLSPACVFLGMTQGFYTSDFNQAYIGCAWGAYHVSMVAVCYGACSAVSSCSSGWMVKRAGRFPIFTAATLLQVGALVLLLAWAPSAQQSGLFFVEAALWGVLGGVYWSQIRAFIGILFKSDEEAAFSTFFLWNSLGFVYSFVVSGYLCISVKIYVLLIVCLVGYVGYAIVERLHTRRSALQLSSLPSLKPTLNL